MPRTLFLLACLAACASRDDAVPELLYTAPASPGRDAYFAALATADYEALDPIIDTLTVEARDGDARSQAILGFAHAWRLSEWRRSPDNSDVTDHARLAMDAFDEATDLLPDDPRLVGFRGSFKQATGDIEDRSGLIRGGWFDTVQAARRWPEWGLFTQAYGLVTLDADSGRYDTGIELLWRNLDECADTSVPRENLDWLPYDADITPEDLFDQRACTNTDVAPHNIEGFFTIFGDMYAKRGDLAEAEMMYTNALALDDGTWPWRSLAEDRVERLESLPTLLSRDVSDDTDVPATDMLVFGSSAGCSICHQAQ